ncbi:MFS transporter [Bacillus sp. AFS017336]|uniref:MFS transporter n=1 Tax=Bacillus sp. AFS017336 TaxID=2033489 RepID=UPI000BEF6655|nr:MFS transporter [Bacillus sp. AFS017336]PEL09950.1 hypothetical protein CN601_15555 [Bacillus sp. AFS017336]
MIKKYFINKDFSFLFTGRLLTNIGDNLYNVAIMWLVYELTNNSFYTGLAGALAYLPELLAVFVGPIVDRGNLKKIIVLSEISQMLLIGSIPVLHYMDILNVYILLGIITLAAICIQFTYPAESALVPVLVKDKDLMQANALMNLAYRGSSLIFKSLSGAIIALIGTVNVFLVDAFTFLIAAVCFCYIKTNKLKKIKGLERANKTSFNLEGYKTDLVLGLKFLKNPVLFHSKFPGILANFMFAAAIVVLPEFSRKMGGVSYYGFFLGAYSVGTLVGSFSFKKIANYKTGTILFMSQLANGFLWITSIISMIYGLNYLCLLFVFLSGIPSGICSNASVTITQKVTPNDMLGRVSSAVGTLLTIGMPLGALFGGYMAGIYGVQIVVMLNGIGSVLCGIYWLINKTIRNLPSLNDFNNDESIKQTTSL